MILMVSLLWIIKLTIRKILGFMLLCQLIIFKLILDVGSTIRGAIAFIFLKAILDADVNFIIPNVFHKQSQIRGNVK